MFGKVAADILGLSDVGSVIKPENYDKVDSDDYVMHEDNERIYFLIKSSRCDWSIHSCSLSFSVLKPCWPSTSGMIAAAA